MFSDFLKTKINEARVKNIQELIEAIKKNDVKLDEKLDNFILRWGDCFENFSKENIKQEICNQNPYVICLFAKDPLKQNIPEKAIEEYFGIKKLPASGKNSICFDENGNITNKIKSKFVSKSADFFINGYYITQKYTGENKGGAQDNQFNDVITFLQYGSKHHKVGALVDGWYWIQGGKKQELKDMFYDNTNVIVFSADEYDKREGVIRVK